MLTDHPSGVRRVLIGWQRVDSIDYHTNPNVRHLGLRQELQSVYDILKSVDNESAKAFMQPSSLPVEPLHLFKCMTSCLY